MADDTELERAQRAEVSVSDPSEFGPLREWLKRFPGVDVIQTPAMPGPGEQGSGDVLTVLASSAGSLAVAIRTLPDFVRSRRSSVSVTVKTGDREVALEIVNGDVDSLEPIIERLFVDRSEP